MGNQGDISAIQDTKPCAEALLGLCGAAPRGPPLPGVAALATVAAAAKPLSTSFSHSQTEQTAQKTQGERQTHSREHSVNANGVVSPTSAPSPEAVRDSHRGGRASCHESPVSSAPQSQILLKHPVSTGFARFSEWPVSAHPSLSTSMTYSAPPFDASSGQRVSWDPVGVPVGHKATNITAVHHDWQPAPPAGYSLSAMPGIQSIAPSHAAHTPMAHSYYYQPQIMAISPHQRMPHHVHFPQEVEGHRSALNQHAVCHASHHLQSQCCHQPSSLVTSLAPRPAQNLIHVEHVQDLVLHSPNAKLEELQRQSYHERSSHAPGDSQHLHHYHVAEPSQLDASLPLQTAPQDIPVLHHSQTVLYETPSGLQAGQSAYHVPETVTVASPVPNRAIIYPTTGESGERAVNESCNESFSYDVPYRLHLHAPAVSGSDRSVNAASLISAGGTPESSRSFLARDSPVVINYENMRLPRGIPSKSPVLNHDSGDLQPSQIREVQALSEAFEENGSLDRPNGVSSVSTAQSTAHKYLSKPRADTPMQSDKRRDDANDTSSSLPLAALAEAAIISSCDDETLIASACNGSDLRFTSPVNSLATSELYSTGTGMKPRADCENRHGEKRVAYAETGNSLSSPVKNDSPESIARLPGSPPNASPAGERQATTADHSSQHESNSSSDDAVSKDERISGEACSSPSQKDTKQDNSSNEVTRCPCGSTKNSGFMIACDGCDTWQHSKCMGIRSKSSVPKKYFCDICRPDQVRPTCISHPRHRDRAQNRERERLKDCESLLSSIKPTELRKRFAEELKLKRQASGALDVDNLFRRFAELYRNHFSKDRQSVVDGLAVVSGYRRDYVQDLLHSALENMKDISNSTSACGRVGGDTPKDSRSAADAADSEDSSPDKSASVMPVSAMSSSSPGTTKLSRAEVCSFEKNSGSVEEQDVHVPEQTAPDLGVVEPRDSAKRTKASSESGAHVAKACDDHVRRHRLTMRSSSKRVRPASWNTSSGKSEKSGESDTGDAQRRNRKDSTNTGNLSREDRKLVQYMRIFKQMEEREEREKKRPRLGSLSDVSKDWPGDLDFDVKSHSDSRDLSRYIGLDDALGSENAKPVRPAGRIEGDDSTGSKVGDVRDDFVQRCQSKRDSDYSPETKVFMKLVASGEDDPGSRRCLAESGSARKRESVLIDRESPLNEAQPRSCGALLSTCRPNRKVPKQPSLSVVPKNECKLLNRSYRSIVRPPGPSVLRCNLIPIAYLSRIESEAILLEREKLCSSIAQENSKKSRLLCANQYSEQPSIFYRRLPCKKRWFSRNRGRNHVRALCTEVGESDHGFDKRLFSTGTRANVLWGDDEYPSNDGQTTSALRDDRGRLVRDKTYPVLATHSACTSSEPTSLPARKHTSCEFDDRVRNAVLAFRRHEQSGCIKKRTRMLCGDLVSVADLSELLHAKVFGTDFGVTGEDARDAHNISVGDSVCLPVDPAGDSAQRSSCRDEDGIDSKNLNPSEMSALVTIGPRSVAVSQDVDARIGAFVDGSKQEHPSTSISSSKDVGNNDTEPRGCVRGKSPDNDLCGEAGGRADDVSIRKECTSDSSQGKLDSPCANVNSIETLATSSPVRCKRSDDVVHSKNGTGGLPTVKREDWPTPRSRAQSASGDQHTPSKSHGDGLNRRRNLRKKEDEVEQESEYHIVQSRASQHEAKLTSPTAAMANDSGHVDRKAENRLTPQEIVPAQGHDDERARPMRDSPRAGSFRRGFPWPRNGFPNSTHMPPYKSFGSFGSYDSRFPGRYKNGGIFKGYGTGSRHSFPPHGSGAGRSGHNVRGPPTSGSAHTAYGKEKNSSGMKISPGTKVSSFHGAPGRPCGKIPSGHASAATAAWSNYRQQNGWSHSSGSDGDIAKRRPRGDNFG